MAIFLKKQIRYLAALKSITNLIQHKMFIVMTLDGSTILVSFTKTCTSKNFEQISVN